MRVRVAAATLLITADDYGYAPPYDAGILAAAESGAIDAVSVMVLRGPDPDPLSGPDVRIGLHLEPLDQTPLGEQWARFEQLFGRAPGHIDGHRHCHAASGGPALEVARLARARGVPVRSVDPRHRRLLRCQGVETPDRLVGRLSEDEPPLPPEVERWREGEPPPGVTEWMVHPGRAGGGSSYDRGREEDLAVVLELAARPGWRTSR